MSPLTLKQTVTSIKALEPQLRACGVARLRLFGSVLRDQAGPESDVDLLIEFRPGAKTYRHFFDVAEMLEAKLGRRVELVTPESLSPFIGPRILAEAQDVLRAA